MNTPTNEGLTFLFEKNYVTNFAPKKKKMAPSVTLELLLAGWITLEPSSPTICDLEMLFSTTTFSTYEVRSSRCSYSTCNFIRLLPKKVLYAMIPLFPFIFFSIKVKGTMWGKQMLHFNCCT